VAKRKLKKSTRQRVARGVAKFMPPCLRSMGCLCAGHARGNPANAACDTSETAEPIRWLVPLTGDEIRLLRGAVDSHLYETFGNEGWATNDGYPIDPRMDRLKSDPPLTEAERAACDAIDEHDALDRMLRDFDCHDTFHKYAREIAAAERDHVVPASREDWPVLRAWLGTRVQAGEFSLETMDDVYGVICSYGEFDTRRK
jgi:hypothetical protein